MINVERIVILGCAGSGKTTLAAQLAQASGAPLICLDAIWQPEWTDADVPRFRELLTRAHGGERWISDGNFSAATFDIRLPRSTLIVWLERPRFVCLCRVMFRVFKKGEAHQKADLHKVIKFIWNFDRKNRPLIESLRVQHGIGVPVIRLRSDRDIGELLQKIAR